MIYKNKKSLPTVNNLNWTWQKISKDSKAFFDMGNVVKNPQFIPYASAYFIKEYLESGDIYKEN